MKGNTQVNSISEMIDGMCSTLQNNKNDIEQLIMNNPSINLHISFSVMPNEIVTMSIYTEKIVKNEGEVILYKEVNVKNENNK